jgi:hypothetical protein
VFIHFSFIVSVAHTHTITVRTELSDFCGIGSVDVTSVLKVVWVYFKGQRARRAEENGLSDGDEVGSFRYGGHRRDSERRGCPVDRQDGKREAPHYHRLLGTNNLINFSHYDMLTCVDPFCPMSQHE